MPRSNVTSDIGSYKLVPQIEAAVELQAVVVDAADSQDELDASFATPVVGVLDSRFWVPKKFWSVEMLEGPIFQLLTVALILANVLVIGQETDFPDTLPWHLYETGFLLAFMLELWLRVSILGHAAFFDHDDNPDFPWNVFDVAIVAGGLAGLGFTTVTGGDTDDDMNVTIFRSARLVRIMRVLRLIRIIKFCKQLYLLAYGFLEAAAAVFWVFLLSAFVLYICSVVLVRSYGRFAEADGDIELFLRGNFLHIPMSMLTLFELVCAPNVLLWHDAMFKDILLTCFLVVFIVLGSFGINGMLISLINESILEKNMARNEADRMDREARRKVLHTKSGKLFDEKDTTKSRVLRRDDLMECKPQLAKLFQSLGVNFRLHDIDQMFYIMDTNDTGIIEKNEFVQGVVELCDQIRPMSIMELHYQISKCLTKVSETDNKLYSLIKNVEDVSLIHAPDFDQARSLVGELRGAVVSNHCSFGCDSDRVSEVAVGPLGRQVRGGRRGEAPVPLQRRFAEYRRALAEGRSLIDANLHELTLQAAAPVQRRRKLELAMKLMHLNRLNRSLLDALLTQRGAKARSHSCEGTAAKATRTHELGQELAGKLGPDTHFVPDLSLEPELAVNAGLPPEPGMSDGLAMAEPAKEPEEPEPTPQADVTLEAQLSQVPSLSLLDSSQEHSAIAPWESQRFSERDLSDGSLTASSIGCSMVGSYPYP